MANIIKLGICISNRKKSRNLLRHHLEELCLKSSIEIVDIDLTKSLEVQGPFHVLLHKIIDFYHIHSKDEADQKINKLINYSRKHKEMIVIDDFNWCLKLTNRKLMSDLLKSCEFSLHNVKVFLPKTLEITENMTVEEIQLIIRKNEMKYPLLVKSLSTTLCSNSHNMALIFSHDHLSDIPQPSLVQEFHNHGGVYYKVFVIGTAFSIHENPSIKDIKHSPSSTIFFNARSISSRDRFNAYLHDMDPGLREWYSSRDIPNMLNRSVIEELITRMRSKTGFQLMKFDILIDQETGNYALIDMNQFPSYECVGDNYLSINLVNLIKRLGSM